MKRRIASLLAGMFVASIGAAMTATPASATGVCVGASGSAGIAAPGLTYPVTATTAGTSATVRVTQPRTLAFAANFATVGTCVNTAGGLPTTKGLTATGLVSGWCGHSSGSGTTSDGYRFAWVSVGGTLVVTGGLVGVANAVPNPTVANNSCLTGATNFLVNGVAAKIHCTVKNKTKTTLPVPTTLTTVLPGPPVTVSVHTASPTYWTKVCVSTNPVL